MSLTPIKAAAEKVPKELRHPGWRWTPHGVQIATGGKRMLVPLPMVVNIYAGCLHEEGLPDEGASVGAVASVGGFFKKISRKLKKTARKIAPDWAERKAKALVKAAKKVGNVAKNIVTHPAFRAGMAGLSMAFPALAPAAVGLEVASRVVKKVEAGAAAAKQIKKGVKSLKNVKAVKEGITAKRAIEHTVRRAQAGDVRAQRAYGGVIGAKVARRAAKRRAIRQMPPEARPRLMPFPWAR